MKDVPAGAVYAVTGRPGQPYAESVAFCGDIDAAVAAMRVMGPVFGCEVFRLEDNAPIWPFRGPGGNT